MTLPPGAVDRFLAKKLPMVPQFKGADPEWLLRTIYRVTGCKFLPKTLPRPEQLEGVALALWCQQSLLFYEMRTGKALPNQCEVATPKGWTKIADLKPGGLVMHPSGSPTRVVGVYPQGTRPMCRLFFSDGAQTIADSEHVWVVQTAMDKYRGNALRHMTTSQLKTEKLQLSSGNGWRYFIPMTEPVQYSEKMFKLDPYLVGVLLGDGSLNGDMPTLTTDDEIIDSLLLPPGVTRGFRNPHKQSVGISTVGFKRLAPFLAALEMHRKMAQTKHIPGEYLFGNVAQRAALLAGLLDTDGWAEKKGNLHWGSTSLSLAWGMQELVQSLGGTACIQIKLPFYTYKGEKLPGRTFFHMSIRLPPLLGCPFRLRRKAERWQPLTKFQPTRAITRIEEAELEEATCIKVEAEDGLFLINDYIVTHNTKMALDWAEHLRRADLWRGKGLVLTHAPIGNHVWQAQAEQHSDLKVAQVQNRPQELLDALESDADLIAMPPTGLQCLFTGKYHDEKKQRNKMGIALDPLDKGGKTTLLDIAAEAFDLCIIDEVHNFGNHSSLWFDMAKHIVARSHYRLGLTGTPFGRNPFKLWAQAYLIDGGKTLSTSYYFFEICFGKQVTNQFGKRKKYQFDRDRQVDLDAKMASFSMAYRLDECYEVVKLSGDVRLNMYGDQREAYDQAIDNVIQLAKGEVAEIENAFIRMRQISSGYLPFITEAGDQRTVKFHNNIKLEWFEDFLDSMPEDLSVIVFHEFTLTGRMLVEACRKHKIEHGWIWGGVPQAQRPPIIQAFQDKRVQVLVLNTATGGMAIDLYRADHMIFYESPCSPIVRQQAEARPLSSARGKRPLTIDDLLCSGVEHRVLSFVQEGRDLLQSIIHARGARLAAMLAALR